MALLSPAEEKARLRWQCRRGLLELDFILERFLDQRYDQLSDVFKEQFNELLQHSDPDLQSWLLSSESSEHTPFPDLIGLIRHL